MKPSLNRPPFVTHYNLLVQLLHSTAALIIAAIATFSPICPEKQAQSAEEKRNPNILFILTDDQGWASLGCYGNKKIKTPNIDKLALEGTRFTNFYVSQPVCTASLSDRVGALSRFKRSRS